jgi:hypothetical protein
MMPLFLFPLAFLGLLGVPTLVAIYLFRNRFKRQPVSSLMLWLDARESREGGARLRTLQTPLLFLLELLVILALVLGAAEPFLRVSATARPLVVVLDNSYSMLAGGEQSPRALAEAALRELYTERPPFSIRFVLAGERPQVLGDAVRSRSEVFAQLAQWKPHASEARLEPALALAGELGGEVALILVLTDHPPPKDSVAPTGRVQWWSLGRPRDNVALTAAGRTPGVENERCLIEVSNLGIQAATRTLEIRTPQGPVLERMRLTLEPGQVRRLTFTFPLETAALHARLDGDDLPVDDQVTLLPVRPRAVRVEMQITHPRIRMLLDKGLQATLGVQRVTERPELFFTDRAGDPPVADATWVVQFHNPEKAPPQAFKGPFVLDRTSPLLEGVSLQSVLWGTAQQPDLEGSPLVMAGNTALLTVQERLSSAGMVRQHVRVRFRPELSTLQETPDWPILLANLVAWRASALPGPTRVNLRLGETATLHLPAYREAVTLIPPEQSPRELAVKGRMFGFPADRLGVWQVRSEDTTWSLVVNALSSAESDLRQAEPGRWGDWLDEVTLRQEYRGLSWLFLVGLLALGCLHLFLMNRGGSRS